MNANYTKGPLRFNRRNRETAVSNFIILEPDVDGIEPCVAYVANVDDARLYAAAPELLEALEGISQALQDYDSKCGEVFGGAVQHRGRTGAELMRILGLIESSRAAIAKATGA
jgi:hypothetical protein